MIGFNKVMLMGNLTRDPELKYLSSQTPVAEFGMAVNRRYKTAQGEEKEEVLFIELTAFGKQAETIHQYCHRGKALFLEGRLKYDQWDDKETGAKRSRLSVIVETFQFVGGKEDRDGSGTAGETKPRQEKLWKEESQKDNSKEKDARRKNRQPVAAGTKFKEADIPF